MTRGRSSSTDIASTFWNCIPCSARGRISSPRRASSPIRTDNGYRPIAQRSVSSYLKSHLEDYNLEASNKIINKSGKQVNGFWGIQALTSPIIL